MIASAIVLSHKPAANAMLIHSISWAWSDFLHFIVMVVASYFCHKEKKANSAACGTRATSHCPCLNSCTGASLWFLTFHSHLHHLPQISILLSRLSGPFSDCLPFSSHTFPMDLIWFFFLRLFLPCPWPLASNQDGPISFTSVFGAGNAITRESKNEVQTPGALSFRRKKRRQGDWFYHWRGRKNSNKQIEVT